MPTAEAASTETAIAAARAGRALDEDHVLVEAAEPLPGATGDPDGRLDVLAYRPGAARFRASVSRPTWLVVREPYYANWRATIDGRPAEIHPAAGFLMGLLVDTGTHEVELIYGEPKLVPGMLGALVALALFPAAFRRCAGPRTATRASA